MREREREREREGEREREREREREKERGETVICSFVHVSCACLLALVRFVVLYVCKYIHFCLAITINKNNRYACF